MTVSVPVMMQFNSWSQKALILHGLAVLVVTHLFSEMI